MKKCCLDWRKRHIRAKLIESITTLPGGSHPRVKDLQSTPRIAESWMLKILDTRMGLTRVDYFSPTCKIYKSNNEKAITRTRQIIRYRATATLRRPQNKQYSASKWGGGGLQNQQEHLQCWFPSSSAILAFTSCDVIIVFVTPFCSWRRTSVLARSSGETTWSHHRKIREICLKWENYRIFTPHWGRDEGIPSKCPRFAVYDEA